MGYDDWQWALVFLKKLKSEQELHHFDHSQKQKDKLSELIESLESEMPFGEPVDIVSRFVNELELNEQ